MVDSAEKAGFVPKPDVSSDMIAVGPVKKPNILARAVLGLGIASFLTSLGIAGTGNAETLVHDPEKAIVSTVDDLQNAAGVGISKVENLMSTPDIQTDATNKVREQLKAQGINFGDPIMVTDPNTGAKTAVRKQGSIEEISTKGAVGTGVVEMQKPIIRYGASTSDKEALPEDIQGINLNDLAFDEVTGGPDHTVVASETPESAKWDRFSGKNGKSLFIADKFVTSKDAGASINNSGGGAVPLPSTPAGK